MAKRKKPRKGKKLLVIFDKDKFPFRKKRSKKIKWI